MITQFQKGNNLIGTPDQGKPQRPLRTRLLKHWMVLCILFCWGFAGAMIWYDNTHPAQCVSSSKVVALLKMEHRKVTVQLENGQTRVVSEIDLQPGDKLCLQWK